MDKLKISNTEKDSISSKWYQSITSEARSRSELFLEPTSDHDVIFVVGRDHLRVYASSAVLKTNSELFKSVLQNKDEKGEVHLPEMADSYAFCVFISLLHPVDGKTDDIKGKYWGDLHNKMLNQNLLH